MTSDSVKHWIRATRPAFLMVSVFPAVIGILAAVRHGAFSPLPAALTVFGAALAQIATNFSNDYFDYVQYEGDIPFGGGSGVIQAGVISPEALLRAAIITFAAGGVIGAVLGLTAGPFIWFLTGLGIIGGYFYTAPPLRLGYRGLAEVTTGISMGPGITVGAFLVQTGDAVMHGGETAAAYVARVGAAAVQPALLSVPLASFVALILFAESIHDIDQDRQTGKITLAVRLGPRRALSLMIGWVALTAVFIGAGAIQGFLPRLLLAALVPAGWVLVKALRTAGEDPRVWLAAQGHGKVSRLGGKALLLYASASILTVVGLAVGL